MYSSWFEVHRISLGDTANTPNTPNSSEICTFQYIDFVAFWRQLYTLQDDHVFCSTTTGALRSTGDIVSEHLGAYRIAFSLSASIWEHLEGSVWLFRVAELFSYNFQTIFHFADEALQITRSGNEEVLTIQNMWVARYLSWSYCLIKSYCWWWPDSYQERNASKPIMQLHNNLWEAWSSIYEPGS